MSIEQWLAFGLRIALISGFLSIVLWVAAYTRMARWWANPVGRNIVVNAVLIAMLLVPTTLSLFFHLTRLNSLTVAWADVALIGLITPVMCWRIVAWMRYKPPPENDGDGDGEA